MNLAIKLIVVMIIGYHSLRFFQLMIKMKQKSLLPITAEERWQIRKFPQKPVKPPNFVNQKWGILMYSLMLLFMLVIFLLGLLGQFNGSYYLILLIPLLQSHHLFPMFAILEEGIIIGNRYVPWSSVKSYRIVSIDSNHRYYGYEKEVNSGFEFILKGTFFRSSVLVTSHEMKEKLTKLLDKHLFEE
jgi:hypothetical protein